MSSSVPLTITGVSFRPISEAKVTIGRPSTVPPSYGVRPTVYISFEIPAELFGSAVRMTSIVDPAKSYSDSLKYTREHYVDPKDSTKLTPEANAVFEVDSPQFLNPKLNEELWLEKASYWRMRQPDSEQNTSDKKNLILAEMAMLPCGFYFRRDEEGHKPFLKLEAVSGGAADNAGSSPGGSAKNLYPWNTFDAYNTKEQKEAVMGWLNWMKSRGLGNFDKRTQDCYEFVRQPEEIIFGSNQPEEKYVR